jgi:hypothetical protein
MSGDGSNTKKIIIGVAIALALSACCCGGIFMGTAGLGIAGFGAAMSQAEPVIKPMLKAQSHERVKELLGTPMEKHGLPMGNINLQNDDGVADYSHGVKGPKGEGKLVVKATKTAGKWSYEKAEIVVGEETIDLLPID